MLIFLLRGRLPWQGYQVHQANNRFNVIIYAHSQQGGIIKIKGSKGINRYFSKIKRVRTMVLKITPFDANPNLPNFMHNHKSTEIPFLKD